jgi:hypothetical protein
MNTAFHLVVCRLVFRMVPKKDDPAWGKAGPSPGMPPSGGAGWQGADSVAGQMFIHIRATGTFGHQTRLAPAGSRRPRRRYRPPRLVPAGRGTAGLHP